MKLTDRQIKNMRRNNKVKLRALSRPCMDCNMLWHPLIMSFDHRDRSEKRGWIPNLLPAAPEVFDAEIAKCDVVCFNCHQIREYLRDINVLKIGTFKQETYRYYHRLVQFLSGGALLRRDAYDHVKVERR